MPLSRPVAISGRHAQNFRIPLVGPLEGTSQDSAMVDVSFPCPQK